MNLGKGGAIALVMIEALALCGCTRMASSQEVDGVSEKRTPGDHTVSIRVAEVERRYIVHVPQDYVHSKRWPVVVMFHGGGGNARGVMWETGWTDKADTEGFLAVFPEGTPPDPTRPGRFRDNPQTWNDGSDRQFAAVEREAADVQFFSAMIGDLNRRFNTDTSRTYATGFSNGASMSFRIARELSHIVAAVAPVAGADWSDSKRPSRAVPLLYITGTADPLNPLEGGEIHIGAKSFGKKPPVEEMIAKWVQLDGLKGDPRVVYEKDGAKGVAYSSARGIDTVVLYTIDEHGHHWPGGRSALPEMIGGKNTAILNATDVVWEFFKKHSLTTNNGTAAQQGEAAADAASPRR